MFKLQTVKINCKLLLCLSIDKKRRLFLGLLEKALSFLGLKSSLKMFRCQSGLFLFVNDPYSICCGISLGAHIMICTNLITNKLAS